MVFLGKHKNPYKNGSIYEEYTWTTIPSVLEAACMKFLNSPGNLEAFLAAGGIEQMKTGCPIALSKVVAEKI
jgi:hypothetical protein